VSTARLLGSRRTHLSRGLFGRRLVFAVGPTAKRFKTTVDGVDDQEKYLLVKFRLRLLRGRWHTLFFGSLLNPPLFVGFPASGPRSGWTETKRTSVAARANGGVEEAEQ
jgi:hypothetical protein